MTPCSTFNRAVDSKIFLNWSSIMAIAQPMMSWSNTIQRLQDWGWNSLTYHQTSSTSLSTFLKTFLTSSMTVPWKYWSFQESIQCLLWLCLRCYRSVKRQSLHSKDWLWSREMLRNKIIEMLSLVDSSMTLRFHLV